MSNGDSSAWLLSRSVHVTDSDLLLLLFGFFFPPLVLIKVSL